MRWRGRYWEDRAVQYLRRRGLKLVQRNYHCPAGEVDIIMRHGATLVFVEVRYRAASRWASAAESVGFTKQRKLARTALHFLQSHPRWQTAGCRFDVVAIDRVDGKQLQLDWIIGAFDSPLV